MAIIDEIKEQNRKLKDMTFSKKCEYIWGYYKFWILGTIGAIILICIGVHDMRLNLRPVYLQVAVLNSNFVIDDTSTILDDYVAWDQIDTEAYNLHVMTSMNIDENAQDQMSLANMEKMVAMISAKTLNVVIAPKRVINHYIDLNAYADLNEVLPKELKAELEEKGYQFYYAKYEGMDHEIPIGIYMDHCPYLVNQKPDGTFSKTENDDEKPIFSITSTTEDLTHSLSFLRMLIEKE